MCLELYICFIDITFPKLTFYLSGFSPNLATGLFSKCLGKALVDLKVPLLKPTLLYVDLVENMIVYIIKKQGAHSRTALHNSHTKITMHV